MEGESADVGGQGSEMRNGGLETKSESAIEEEVEEKKQ